jgi:hypothetical protein
MRFKIVSIFLIPMVFAAGGRAADQTMPAAGATAPVKLAPASEPAAPKFSDAQLSRVSGWMRTMAPSCPPAAMASAAQHFLEELQWRQPDKLERLLADGLSAKDFESMLLRHLAAQLTAAPQAALREELACRRVQVLLAQEDKTPASTPQTAAALIEKLKGNSQVYYRRLLEGRIEDEDLEPLLQEARQAGTASAHPASTKPQALTADDILAEFSRHNQKDLALEHLRAYTVDGRLTEGGGTEQRLLLFKLRPDRFRLHVLVGETTRYILSDDGAQFWQQVPGGKPQVVSRESLGVRAYLAEFVDPLFGEMDNYTFERIEDGTLDGRKIYRIAVRRPDGSQYVAGVDAGTFHEVDAEYAGGMRVLYSDFREVAGVTVAFREETTDRTGHKTVLVLTRFTANPGLVQEFFETVPGHDLNYFAFEQLSARAPVAIKP